MLRFLSRFFNSSRSKASQTELSATADVSGASEQSVNELFIVASKNYDRGDSVGALDQFMQVYRLDPRHLKTVVMLGFLYKERGNFEQAKRFLQQAIQLDAESADAYYLLGCVAAAQNQAEQMIDLFAKSLALDPHQERLYLEFSFALFQIGRVEEAIALLERGLKEFPEHKSMLQYLGNMHLHRRQNQAAYEAYSRALKQAPNPIELLYSHVICCMTLMKFDEALENLLQIQAQQPDHVMANFEEGILRLQKGEYERGWRQFQWRWKTAALADGKLNTDKPFWDGSQELDGKTILILSEQGAGDTIQFCRFIPELKRRGAFVVFVTSLPLLELMRQVPGVDLLIDNKEPLPPFDYYCELMSLPLGLQVTLENIPSSSGYLRCSDEKRRTWSAHVAQQVRPIRIGLVWSGNVRHTNNHMRSITFDWMKSLFELDADFTILQKELSDIERAEVASIPNAYFYGDELADFADTAALIDLMDVVVTVDTSVAHLAAAMGKPTWVLISFMSDWRWLLDTNESPWYDSVRLFRQAPWKSWQEPIMKVKLALQELINAK